MEINLCIDCGNSHLKWATYEGVKKTGEGSLESDEYHKIEHRAGIEGKEIRTVYCSVNNNDSEMREMLKARSKRFVELTESTTVPIKNLYKNPEKLGKDRLAAAIGAREVCSDRDCLVIDLGTAATFDFVTKEGEFAGGNIAPGLNMRTRALHEHTAKLPAVDAKNAETEVLYGTDTESAIALGAANGLACEIIVNMIKARERGRVLTILTGGNAKFFEKRLKSSIFASIFEKEGIDLNKDLLTREDLVLTGLNRILEYNI